MKTICQTITGSFYRLNVLVLLMLFNISCTSATRDSEHKDRTRSASLHMGPQEDTIQWKQNANKMVEDQLISRGITDKKVLQAMENTQRHLFVPKSLKGHEKVLEIGTGSGYQAAILSQLADSCYTIELIKSLADSSSHLLKRLGYNNVIAKCDDGYKGWPEHAPFDCIIITAAPEEIPEKLVDQLKVNGRMVVPVGKFYQQLVLITKTEKGIKKKNIIPVRFVPMVKPK